MLRYTTGAALIVAGVAALAMQAPAAAADNLGTLTFDPPTGTDLLAPKVHTPAGCPDTTDGYAAIITGPGAFADGYAITPTRDVNFSTTEGFDVQLGLNFRDVATELGTVVAPGDYQITVNCVDMFKLEPEASFTGRVTFTAAPTADDPALMTYTTGPAGTTGPTTPPTTSPTATESPSPTPTETESPSPTATTTAPETTSTPDATTPAVIVPATTSPAVSTSPVAATGGLPITGPPTGALVTVGVLFILLGAVIVAGTGSYGRNPQW
ncbi:hypothetical protein [Paractinoplanes atraurantiacus]|uniref:LPXTG-motif cell wall anchor domain-containing protein n=1 Tax=Paractinoplanes atraurantiacus TaxID=1036182 RepID=A0A285JPK6_9ACTN|nr:hypothetical protein [Actinoplanes atraurantiacus]SNY62229.1 hypothetical protein SAMN05421748_123107 [Actinoplanes atraurantiacus]